MDLQQYTKEEENGMKEPEHYRKLISAAKKGNKSELEIYINVSKSIDEILNKETEQDNCLVLKALITYIEGKSVHSWFMSIMPIAYALIIGATSLIPTIDALKIVTRAIIIILLCCATVVTIVAVCNFDFERKVVVRILNDKLNELELKSKFDINIAVVETQDKKLNGKKKKRKNK